MDLPEELRRIILEMAMPDLAKDDTRWDCQMYSEPLVPRQFRGPEEKDYGYLSVAAATGNQRLRQETILVALEKGIISLCYWHDKVAECLTRVDFGLLRQAGTTDYQNGCDAVRRLHINHSCEVLQEGPT